MASESLLSGPKPRVRGPVHPAGRPYVIAHRGASVERAEHTLPAYVAALEQGADGVECDVRLTRDRHLVCVHDRRAERTSNGHGIIATLELADLERLDWASWKSADTGEADEAPLADPERGRLLTLRRLLDTLNDQHRDLVTLVETKHPTRYAGDVERALALLLQRMRLAEGDGVNRPLVRVMSFSWQALKRVRLLAPRTPLVLLIRRGDLTLSTSGKLPKGVGTAGLDIKIVRNTPGIVAAYQGRGHHVYVWTVNTEADMRLCVDLGVQAIISDRPGTALAVATGRG